MKITQKKSLTTSFLIISIILSSIYVFAVPSQPTLTYLSNSTSTTAGIGKAQSGDRGGYITTANIDASQQNYAWKAYVGNVSGKFILEDSDQYSIYEWNMQLSALGNIFISRNGTVNWPNINCSPTSLKESEDGNLSLNPGNVNSINKTFANKAHKQFRVSGLTYQNSTCYSIATYINDTAQVLNETAKFQEVLLSDNTNLVYMTMIEQDKAGYNINYTYDFQAIVGEDESKPTPTTYYFYVELEG